MKFFIWYVSSWSFILKLISCDASELPPDTPVNEIRGYLKREHSLVKPYQGSGIAVPYWDFIGSTIISNQYIRLTPATQSRQGGLWNTVPLRSRDWEMMVTFAIHGTTGELHGDGLAVWYMKDRNQLGPVFGAKDFFTGMGIFLDTYSNHNGAHNHAHPYLSAMINNGTLHYDHDRDGTHTQLGSKGCSVKFRNKDHETSLLLRYVEDTIQVYTDVENAKKWKMCFSVSGVRLPLGYYLGVTGATGELTDNHDVIAVKTYELEIARAERSDDVDRVHVIPHAQYVSAPRDHIDDPPPSKLGSFGIGLLVILTLGGVAVIVVIGIVVLQRRVEASKKRFY